MWIFICAVFIVLASANARSEDGRPSWSWSWQCVNGQCVRNEFLSVDGVQGSLDVCRLTCGRYGSLWPRPTGHTVISQKVLGFDPSRVRFDLSDAAVRGISVRDFLTACTRLFINNLIQQCGGNCSFVPDTNVTVHISVTSPDLALNWRTDESYSVEVATKANRVTVQISANTVFGARHALETLSQLVAGYTGSGGRTLLVIVTSARISDKPVYPHRGLLIDTTRNFLPVSTIKRTIDAMSASKLNVLHWHATDSQSFPIDSLRVPQLARFGAYSAKEIYSATDISSLLEYGKERGVRIMLEIDAPAHAGNGWQWGQTAGLGNLAVCVNQQPWRQYCIQPPCGQLNPANHNVYRVLRDLYRDIIDLLPSGEIFHMGGDEVFYPCWNSSKEIIDWMDSRGMGRSTSDFLQVWAEYQKTALNIWDEEVGHAKSQILLWSSHLTSPGIIEKYLEKDRYVIQTWVEKLDPLPTTLLDLGYRVIISTKDAWYLDHGFWGRTVYHNWRVVYNNRLPLGYKGVLGGEAAMWGELVDEHSIDSKVWPRAAALAERLWTDPDSSSGAAEYRLLQHRQRLVTRGVAAEAITPEWCYQNEGQCS